MIDFKFCFSLKFSSSLPNLEQKKKSEIQLIGTRPEKSDKAQLMRGFSDFVCSTQNI